MAADITLWQMFQETKTQKTDPPKDYLSALWSEYKREKSDKMLGRLVQYDNNALPQESVDLPPQVEARQHNMHRVSMVDKKPEVEVMSSRHGSVDSTIDSQTMAKAAAAAAVRTKPGGDSPRRTSWWKRPVNGKDAESFVHMAFSVS